MDPVTGTLLVGGLAMGAYSAFGPKKGPDYSNVTRQFQARNAQIGDFSRQLAASRTKYLTSLNNMYNDAYTRFSGTAEAGFANRGMSVSGGAFASALARKSSEYSFQGANAEAGMEREDLRSVDSAYGANSGAYMSGISGGPVAQYQGDRQDMAGFANTLGQAANVYNLAGGAGSRGATNEPAWMAGSTQAGRYRANQLQLEYGRGENRSVDWSAQGGPR